MRPITEASGTRNYNGKKNERGNEELTPRRRTRNAVSNVRQLILRWMWLQLFLFWRRCGTSSTSCHLLSFSVSRFLPTAFSSSLEIPFTTLLTPCTLENPNLNSELGSHIFQETQHQITNKNQMSQFPKEKKKKRNYHHPPHKHLEKQFS